MESGYLLLSNLEFIHNIILMKNKQDSRTTQNQTATFNKLPIHAQQNESAQSSQLFQIPEQSNTPSHLNQSLAMPQPLIKNQKPIDNTHQFDANLQTFETVEQSKQTIGDKANLTFHPNFAQQMFYNENSLQQLKDNQTFLKKELQALNETISQLVDKKNEIVNQYENVIKQKKAYNRLAKNLKEQYEGYLFMLEGDYCLKVQQAYEQQKKYVAELKKQVHALDVELSKPLIKDIYQNNNKVEKLQKELFEMQVFYEKQKASNAKKQQKIETITDHIRTKETDMKTITKKIERLQYQLEDQQINVNEGNYKIVQQRYEELQVKMSRIRKVRDLNDKNKEIEYYKKIKDCKEKDQTLKNIDKTISQWDQKIKLKLNELQRATEQKSLLKNRYSEKKKIRTQVSQCKIPNTTKAQRSISTFNYNNREYQTFMNRQDNSQVIKTNYHKLVTLGDPRRNANQQDNQQSMEQSILDDRPELLMRKKRIYTELQKNMYFKNIQNSQQEKISRLVQFTDKRDINISSYDKFQKENTSKANLKLPEIERPQRLHSQETAVFQKNKSIIHQFHTKEFEPQRKLNKPSIDSHNKYMKQLRANRFGLNKNNYRQLCGLLNRQQLLIEQDCEYELSDLIYNSKY